MHLGLHFGPLVAKRWQQNGKGNTSKNIGFPAEKQVFFGIMEATFATQNAQTNAVEFQVDFNRSIHGFWHRFGAPNGAKSEEQIGLKFISILTSISSVFSRCFGVPRL